MKDSEILKLYLIFAESEGSDSFGERHRKAVDEINKLKEKLNESLTDEQKTMLVKMSELNNIAEGEVEQRGFVCGFKAGMKMAAEVYLDDEKD